VGCPLLAPPLDENGMEDVAGGEVVAGKFCSHDGSFTENGVRGAVRLEK
jgi:hypothetical protein